MSIVVRLMTLAEDYTSHELRIRVANLSQKETKTMSKYEYIAHLTEISREISAKTGVITMDSAFKHLASVPREMLAIEAMKLVGGSYASNNQR